MPRKQVNIGTMTFSTQRAAKIYVKERFDKLKNAYELDFRKKPHVVIVKGGDGFDLLVDLFENHPEKMQKLQGLPLVGFKFHMHPLQRGSYHLEVIASDGINKVEPSFSWNCCITNKTKSQKAMTLAAMRSSISMQIAAYKKKNKACTACKSTKSIEIDHCGDKEFKQLAEEFLTNDQIDINQLKFQTSNITLGFDVSDNYTSEFCIAWNQYHLDNATLQALCKSCHSEKTHSSSGSDSSSE